MEIIWKIDFGKRLDVADDGFKLRLECVHLFFGEIQPCELCYVTDIDMVV
jgi:hypothetical protein